MALGLPLTLCLVFGAGIPGKSEGISQQANVNPDGSAYLNPDGSYDLDPE